MTYTTTSVRLIGTVRGNIWMPNTECTKDIDHTFRMGADRHATGHWRGDWPGSVRDALLSEFVTNDGDFQSCALEPGAVVIVTRVNPETGTRRVRTWELRANISDHRAPGYIADCFTVD